MRDDVLRKVTSHASPGLFLPSARPLCQLCSVCCWEQRQSQLRATKLTQSFAGLVLSSLVWSEISLSKSIELCYRPRLPALQGRHQCAVPQQRLHWCPRGLPPPPIIVTRQGQSWAQIHHSSTAGHRPGRPWAGFAFAASPCRGAGCAEARPGAPKAFRIFVPY